MQFEVHLEREQWLKNKHRHFRRPGLTEPFGNLKTAPLDKILAQDTGFFAIIEDSGDNLTLAVDHVRSIPLFYAKTKNGNYLISDNAHWIQNRLGYHSLDIVAYDEMLSAAYVTGNATLHKDIAQVQAGEVVTISSKGVTRENYFIYPNSPYTFPSQQIFISENSKNLRRAIDNLIAYADGRQIVIPLSGGYDSRIIATLLKQTNYPNVICFSYGLKNNHEALVSKRVADALGLSWVFCEYNPDEMRNVWKSAEADRYKKMAGNLTGLPHIQDWFAIKYLRKNNIVENDCVFVPGHCGDFLKGSNTPDYIQRASPQSLPDLMSFITEKRYFNAPESFLKLGKDSIAKKIRGQLGYRNNLTKEEFIELEDRFRWRERMAKFIVNAVRAYEFFGYDWWLPLFDRGYMKFWGGISPEFKFQSNDYSDWIEAEFHSTSKVALNLGNSNSISPTRKLVKTLTLFLPDIIRQPALNYYRIIVQKYKVHHLAAYATIPNKTNRKLMAKGFNRIGIFSYLFLNDEWGQKK